MESKNTFKKDLYRYYGKEKESLQQRLLRPMEIKFLYFFRRAQGAKNILSKVYYKLRLRKISAITHIQIPVKTDIGEGFYIGHNGRIVINPRAKIGRNVNIACGAVIGQEFRGRREGTPVIGDRCWIGTNAVIVGNVTIGDNVLIAPLSFVNFDVPPNSIVVGNPGRIIEKENATEGYMNNLI